MIEIVTPARKHVCWKPAWQNVFTDNDIVGTSERMNAVDAGIFFTCPDCHKRWRLHAATGDYSIDFEWYRNWWWCPSSFRWRKAKREGRIIQTSSDPKMVAIEKQLRMELDASLQEEECSHLV